VDQCAGWIAACLSLVVPVIGLTSMLVSRCSRADRWQRCDQWYFAALVLVTLTTVRTMLAQDPAWLIHGLTLGAMIVGGVAVPTPDEKALRRRLIG